WGDTNDLPVQLVDAARRILHEYFSLLQEPDGMPVKLFEDFKREKLVDFVVEQSMLEAGVKALVTGVKELRKIDRSSWLYQYSVDFMLDRIKSRIKKVDS
ncbi:MAG: hypothetical protein HYU33_06080, partial [Candidatus Omnitrophica bacterium]|nr:hypothetical protein [Candidatus Omnitrophota bacterium]